MRRARERKARREPKERRELIPELQKYSDSEEVSDMLAALEAMKLSNDIRRQYAIRLLDEQTYRRLPESR